MKKLIIIVLALTLIVASCLTLVACNENTGVDTKSKVIDIKLTEEEYAFAVGKDNEAFLAEVNAFLAEIKENGKFQTIIDKYFGDGTPTAVVSAEKNASKDQLIVATNAAFAPFEYMEGNNFFGIDMEIANELAKKLDKELVILNIEFESVVPSVNKGDANIGMAGLTITEVRKEMVTFSNSYYDASQVVVVKNNDTTFDACVTAADVEAILKSKPKKTKIGVQKGTTGQFYVEGDADWDFVGYKVKCVPYANGALAVQDMLNGKLSYVIIDEAPAKAITTAMNKISD